MPRTSRVVTDQTAYHVLARGNNQQPVFNGPEDYQRYLALLSGLLSKESTLRCHHYCLMSDHVHLLLYVEQAAALPVFLHRLQLTYSWYHRRQYGRSGHLWQGRYKSLPIRTEAELLEAGRYIERVPLEAGEAASCQAHPWSSARWSVGGESDPILSASSAYLGLGVSPEARRAAWRKRLLAPRPYGLPSVERIAAVFQGW